MAARPATARQVCIHSLSVRKKPLAAREAHRQQQQATGKIAVEHHHLVAHGVRGQVHEDPHAGEEKGREGQQGKALEHRLA